MLIFLSIPLLCLFVAIYFFARYQFKIKPKQILETLHSQGASKASFDSSPNDILYGIKKSTQKDPDIKAFARAPAGRIVLNLIDADLIKQVLTNPNNYTKLGKTSELTRMFNRRGITASEGDQWKIHRRIVSEAFQYDLFNDMIPTIVETSTEVLDVPSKQQKTIKVPNHIELITSEVITRIFFGLKSSNVFINGKKASEEATEIIKNNIKYNNSPLRFTIGLWIFNLTSDYRKQKQRIRNFRKVFGQKIQERMKEIQAKEASEDKPTQRKRRDLLEILLQHRITHNYDPSQTLSDEEILDEFSVFFLAGKDTTSLLVSMSLYCYVTYPEWGQKIKKEIDETVQDFSQLNLDTLNSMDNLSAFINEVLRMYPPGPAILPRVAKRDHYIGNFFVKKGYILNTMFIANNYNPKYFEDPETFNPTRWLKFTQNNEGWKNNSFAYLPFSAGPRNCVGKHLALMEAKTILSIIIKNFDIKIEPGFTLKLGTPSLGYGPVPPIPIILKPN